MHSFGIAHRDLKPENILLVDKSEEAPIKLVDFGLSRTFGPGETTSEPYGTLCYVAPEILLQQPYEKPVDCWSLGVIIFLLLGRHLPFDSRDEKQISKKTIMQPVTFHHFVWKQVTDEAKDLILKLLVRKPADRLEVSDVLDHPWIVGEDSQIKQLRRKSFDDKDQVLQFVAYSNPNIAAI
jgi:serine/threonine protein kinase